MNTLFLRLDGPLQSWGERARWTVRDSAPEPTKSGVIGLLACALGWGQERSADIAALSRSLRMGVRCDRPGQVLRDFHTVHGGARSADGKVKITQTTKVPETVVSTRYYLADASFLVALRGEERVLASLGLALEQPVWPVFLGRRSCPPAEPVLAGSGEFADLESALRSGPELAPRAGGRIRLVLETDDTNGVRRRDEILDLGVRLYGHRRVSDAFMDLPEVPR